MITIIMQLFKQNQLNASRNICEKGVPKSTWIGDRGVLNNPAVLKI